LTVGLGGGVEGEDCSKLVDALFFDCDREGFLQEFGELFLGGFEADVEERRRFSGRHCFCLFGCGLLI